MATNPLSGVIGTNEDELSDWMRSHLETTTATYRERGTGSRPSRMVVQLVAASLATWTAGHHGGHYPDLDSVATLASGCSLSERTVRRALAVLMAEGLAVEAGPGADDVMRYAAALPERASL